jgi:hypothetical protein
MKVDFYGGNLLYYSQGDNVHLNEPSNEASPIVKMKSKSRQVVSPPDVHPKNILEQIYLLSEINP